MGWMRFYSSAVVAVAMVAPAVVDAYGDSGVVPTNVAPENGNVYFSGDFQHLDQWATSSVGTLQAKDADELNRMLSTAIAAMLSNRKVSILSVGCASVPRFPAAALASSIESGR